MCTYSASNGHLTNFHLVHFAGFAYRGTSLTIIEATSVLPNSRISPKDSGLWADLQIAPICRIADFLHSQNQKLGIQLALARRKASTLALWVGDKGRGIASKEARGQRFLMPKEISAKDVRDVIEWFRDNTRRAVEAGVNVIKIHSAYKYLIFSFLSPISNRRTDKYSGSFENRIRLLVEVIQAIREVVPKGMPLLVRVSTTEWIEKNTPERWDVESTIKLTKLLPVRIAGRVRKALYKAGIKDLLIGAVGMITEAEAEAAKDIVQKGDETVEIIDENGGLARADIVLVARQFLREPEWVLRVTYRLGLSAVSSSSAKSMQFIPIIHLNCSLLPLQLQATSKAKVIFPAHAHFTPPTSTSILHIPRPMK
ncbi:hypothetical protein DL95DRAFT_493850 [Leptodontidium sp. 2 PMI_412]|nr:hypothetical protein DL95DRAFT_493850 [Leptodontidium sp. 2 PMI_412]